MEDFAWATGATEAGARAWDDARDACAIGAPPVPAACAPSRFGPPPMTAYGFFTLARTAWLARRSAVASLAVAVACATFASASSPSAVAVAARASA